MSARPRHEASPLEDEKPREAHVRNIGICAVVFGAAAWKYNNMGSGHLYVLDVLIIVLLITLGLFLFLVNQFHGIATLRKVDRPKWVLELIMHTYSIVAVTIVFAVVGVHR
jgi:hypothetical protein